MSKEDYEKEIRKLTKQIVDGYNPHKIILFGSLLHGKLTNDSDIDLLVIKDDKDNYWDRVKKIAKIVNINAPKDIILMNFEELEERKRLKDFFVMDIINNGKVLYEKRQ